MDLLKKLSRIAAVCTAYLFMMPMAASAHTLWLNCTDYNPDYSLKTGAKTKIYVGWGHRFPVDSYVDAADFEEITLVKPSKASEQLVLETTGFASKQLNLKEEGLHVIGIVRKEAYNTSYRENGKVVSVKGTKEGRSDVVNSSHSQQFAKTLISAGKGSYANLSYALGHKLEIIPVDNPFKLENNRGGVMRVKVLLDGKPVPYVKVFGMYEGYSSKDAASSVVSTNSEGIAELRIDHWGTWILKTRVDREPLGEMRKKVNKESFFASLTFAVP